MTISQMHDMIKFLKSQGQNAFHTPEQIDRALNSASYDKFNEERKMYQKSEFIGDNLKPFITISTITVVDGVITLPSNYAQILNITESGRQVDIVSHAEFSAQKLDPIDPPSTSRRIAYTTGLGTTFFMQPSSVGTQVIVHYIRKPVAMKFNYTVSAEDYVYTSSGSTDCDWPESGHVDIVRRAMVYLGTPMDDSGLIRLEDYKRKTEDA